MKLKACFAGGVGRDGWPQPSVGEQREVVEPGQTQRTEASAPCQLSPCA